MATNLNRFASAYLGITANTVYTTPTSTAARIDACALTNTDKLAQTVSIWLVASGSGPTNANCVLASQQIGPGQTYIVKGALGQVLKQGGTIQAQASSADKVNIYASGVEIS